MNTLITTLIALRIHIQQAFLCLLLGIILTNIPALTQTAWIPEGPTGNFGSASQSNVNGRIRSIQILSTGGDYYVYVGASSGGIWRTLGSTGSVWTSLGDNLPNPSVGAFAVHPNLPDEIWVGTGDWQRYAGTGMFHTNNGGQTWSKISLPVNPRYFFKMYYFPGNPNIMLAATDVGLLRWEGGSGTLGVWSVVLTGNISDLVIHPTNQNIQYCSRNTTVAGNDGGIYRSDDAGKTWRLITAATAPVAQFGIGRIAICRNSPNNLAFVYEWGCNIKGIGKSTDGGNTWTRIERSFPKINDAKPSNDQACHALAIAILPDNPNQMYVGANELWKTVDGGQDWEYVPKTIHIHQDYTQLYFSPVTGDNVMWLCNDGGVYRYPVGESIAASWNGDYLTGLRVAQVADMDAQLSFRVIGLQDDGAVAWNYGASFVGYIGYTCCDVYNVVITDAGDPTFWYSMDESVIKQPYSGSGKVMSDATQPLFKNSAGHLFFDRFTNKVYTLLASGGAVVSRWATDLGSYPWNTEIALPKNVSAMSGSYLNGQTLFVWGGDPGVLTVLQKNGTTWTALRSPTIGGKISGINYSIQSVFASTERPDESWAGLSNVSGTESPGGIAMILHTTDNWQTWNELSRLPTEAGQVTAIAVMPFDSRQIFVGTDVGMYRTQDGGATWQPFQAGLPSIQCRGLRYLIDPTHHGNDKLVVSTYGRGLYECTISRQGIVYVYPRLSGLGDGTFEHPYFDFDMGFAKTPNGGILALHGDIYPVPQILNKPMTINAYEFTVKLTKK